MTDEQLVVSYEVSHALASAAIQFLTRIDGQYGDIAAIADFRREFYRLHAKYVVPRRDDLLADLTVKTVPNLKLVK